MLNFAHEARLFKAISVSLNRPMRNSREMLAVCTLNVGTGFEICRPRARTGAEVTFGCQISVCGAWWYN
jgi:hypothetical protein